MAFIGVYVYTSSIKTFLLVTYGILFAVGCFAGANLEVFDSPSLYEVTVFAESGPQDMAALPSLPVTMQNNEGESFQCYIPIPFTDTAEAADKETEALLLKWSADKVSLLKPYCFFRYNYDWWTFVLCPGGFAKQVHVDESTAIDPLFTYRNENILGRYDPSAVMLKNWSSAEKFSRTWDFRGTATAPVEKIFTEKYTNGSENHLVTVYYRCGKPDLMLPLKKIEQFLADEKNPSKILAGSNANALGKLSQIQEDPERHYHFLLETPLLCNRTEWIKLVFESEIEHLSKLKSCVRFVTGGWWSYDVCPGSEVRQYHVNPQGEIEQHFSLGKFHHSTNHRLRTLNKAFRISKTSGQHSYTEIFLNGTACDMTGLPRTTEVKYLCSKHIHGAGSAPEIVNIEEGLTCNYTIKVHFPSACELEQQLQTKQQTQKIKCFKKI